MQDLPKCIKILMKVYILTVWVSAQVYSSCIILNGLWTVMKITRKQMHQYWQMEVKPKKKKNHWSRVGPLIKWTGYSNNRPIWIILLESEDWLVKVRVSWKNKNSFSENKKYMGRTITDIFYYPVSLSSFQKEKKAPQFQLKLSPLSW